MSEKTKSGYGDFHPDVNDPVGVTIEMVAAAKRLPVKFLESLGWENWYQDWMKLQEGAPPEPPKVMIPYFDQNGVCKARHLRFSLDQEPRFRWRRGDSAGLYGLDRLKTGIDASPTVILVEGETDCATLWLNGFCAIGVPGPSAWDDRRDAQQLVAYEKIYVVVEPDKGGDRLFSVLARSLLKDRFCRVHLGGVKDTNELFQANPLEFKQKFELAMRLAAPMFPRPVVLLKAGEIDSAVDDVETALALSGKVFQRGGELVVPVLEDQTTVPDRVTGAHRTVETLGLHKYSVHSLRDRISREVDFFSAAKPKDPPIELCLLILARQGTWKVPAIAGLLACPTLRPDGSILAEPGYDPTTRLYLHLDTAVRGLTVPAKPTKTDAQAALGVLEELLAEFAFVTAVDKAVALSGLLSPVLRAGLATVPGHAINAAQAGTGKSYLVDIISLLATGRVATAQLVPERASNEELEKILGGAMLKGSAIIALDNVNGELASSLLCQLLERPLVSVRKLAKSDLFDIENAASVFINGNNLTPIGDLTRRLLLCNMDAMLARPELRVFKASPKHLVANDRATYLTAVLTIGRAYILAGRPDKITPPLASYQEWSDLVRSALVWLGCADPVASQEQIRNLDPVLEEATAFIAELRRLKLVKFTVHELVAIADRKEADDSYGNNVSFKHPVLRNILLLAAPGNALVPINRAKLGRWLARLNRKIFPDGAIRRADTKSPSAIWELWT